MSKYITVYKSNKLGDIEKVETIDGVVVEEQPETQGGFSDPRTWGGVWKWWTGVVGGGSVEKSFMRNINITETSATQSDSKPQGFGDGSSNDVDGTDVRGWWS